MKVTISKLQFLEPISQSFAMAAVGVLIISIMLSACVGGPGPVSVAPPQGVIYALHFGTTAGGALRALSGAQNAQIFLREVTGTVTFVWPFYDGIAYFTVCSAACEGSVEDFIRITGGKASLVNAMDMKTIREIMEYNGWKLITAAEVPVAVRTALTNMQAVANAVGSTFFTWVVFPVVPSTIPEGAVRIDL